MVTHSSNWLLDTNILSEACKPQPNAQVLELMNRYKLEFCTAAPVWHELRFGWLRMPDGQRKDKIGRYIQQVVSAIAVLPYDEAAARIHANIRRECEQMGLVLSFVDGQIASIAMAHGLTLVTRNLKDFENIQGLRVVSWCS